MQITLAGSPWWLLLILPLALGLAAWSYHRLRVALPRSVRWGLAALRFLVLAGLATLLLEPRLERTAAEEIRPTLNVLVDASSSVRWTQRSDTTAAAPRRIAGSILRAAAESGLDTELYVFDRSTRSVPAAELGGLPFDGGASDIGSALLAPSVQSAQAGGILLLSDGNANEGPDPLYAARRSSLPVFTAALGDTSALRDVYLSDLTTNSVARSGQPLPVRVQAGRTEASADTTLSLELRVDGRRVARTQLRFPAGQEMATTTVQWTPTRLGARVLSAVVLAGDDVPANDEATRAVRVIENTASVWLITGPPDADAGLLARWMQSPVREVRRFLLRPDGTWIGAPPPTDSLPDLLVTHDLPEAPLPDELLAAARNEGTALFAVSARAADLDRLGTSLPLQPPAESLRLIRQQATPVPSAVRHVAFGQAALDATRRLPPLLLPEGPLEVRSGSMPILRARASSGPVLATLEREGRRTAAWVADELWRWSVVGPDLEAEAEVWATAVERLAEWLATPPTEDQLQVHPVRSAIQTGEALRFRGEVYDERLEPVADAAVDLVLRSASGEEIPQLMRSTGGGQYEATFSLLPPGRYAYEASARLDDRLLGRDAGTVQVGAATPEREAARAEADLLKAIAAVSGGRFFTADSAASMMRSLSEDSAFTPERVQGTHITPLYFALAVLVAAILMLVSEWIVRKVYGLP